MRETAGSAAGNPGRGWPSMGGESQRASKPVTVAELLAAIGRIESSAVTLADKAYEAIQHHSFDPYRQFCEKRTEHAALMSVLRAHIGPRPENPNWMRSVDDAEASLIRLSIQACVKFAFALSANALMPLGARETFSNELGMLNEARERLAPSSGAEAVDTLLGEIDMAKMILEEVIEKAPAFEEF